MRKDIDLKSKFLQVYDSIKSDLLHDPAFEFDDDSRQWVERMIDYNVPGGKMTRGLSVLDSYKLLKGESELTDDELFLACALGWCIEWVIYYIRMNLLSYVYFICNLSCCLSEVFFFQNVCW
ncbi:putative transferase [Helianthus annuus]|nr:putative transferase [Helianthus annuus]